MSREILPQAAAGHVPAAVYEEAVARSGGYQPVIVVQAPAAQRQVAPLVLAGVVGGGLVVAVLLAVAVVAVAVGIGAISCTIGWLVIRQLVVKGVQR